MKLLERFKSMFGGKVQNSATYSQDVYESFGVSPSSAGIAVTPETALSVSAAYACVRILAGAIASLPIHTYQKTANGRERVDHATWWLLNEKPNPRYIAASMWEKIITDMVLRGDSYVFIGRDIYGNIVQLIPLPHASVSTILYKNNPRDAGVLKYFVSDMLGNYQVDASDILHFPNFGFDGIRGKSCIQYAARTAIGAASAMDTYAGKFFANGAHPSIVLKTPAKMSPNQVESLQKAFATKYSGIDNAHAIPLVLTDGMQSESVSINATDAQLLEARKFTVLEIARAFLIPPHLIGETSASTSWGSGIESMGRAFVTYSLESHLKKIEQEINSKFWPKREKYFVEIYRDALMAGDSKAQAEYYRAALGGPGAGRGWMTVDEVRKLKNLPPMGGDCAEIFDPLDQKETPAEEAKEELAV